MRADRAITTLLVVLAASPAAGSDRATDVPVVVVVDPGSRHREELARELEAYRFRAIFVAPDELTIGAQARGGLHLADAPARLEAFVNEQVGRRTIAAWVLPARDRLGRQRALLAAIEALRAELVLPPASTVPRTLESPPSSEPTPVSPPAPARAAPIARTVTSAPATTVPTERIPVAPTAVPKVREASRPPAQASVPARWSGSVGAAVIAFRGAGTAVMIEGTVAHATSSHTHAAVTIAGPAWTTSPSGPEGSALVRPYAALAQLRRVRPFGPRVLAHGGIGAGALLLRVEGQPNAGYVADRATQWSALLRLELGASIAVTPSAWIGVAASADVIAPDVAIGFAGLTVARWQAPLGRAAVFVTVLF